MTKIQTMSGRMVDVTNMKPDDVCLGDIVYPLSRLARFNGHTKRFYSVAQHSVIVSLLIGNETADWTYGPAKLRAARWALFHDAHEAYIGDIARPLKPLAGKLVDCAYAIDGRVREMLGLPMAISDAEHAAVKRADELALKIERRDLLEHWASWGGDVVVPFEDVRNIESDWCLVPSDAEKLFLNRYNELFGLEATLSESPVQSKLWGGPSGLFMVKQQPRKIAAAKPEATPA